MSLTIVNPLEIPNWDDLIAEHEEAMIFHTSSWARVLRDSYGYKPCYMVSFENNRLKILVPIMEIKSFLTGTRGVSLPFTDFCPPLVSSGVSLEENLVQIFEFARKSSWKHVELRGATPGMDQISSSVVLINHTLALSKDPDEIKTKFRSSTKRNIKKSFKEGVTVIRDDTINGVMEFCRLNSLTRRDHGLPPQPLNFFRNLHKFIIKKGNGSIFLGNFRNQTIAAIVCLHYGKKAIYKYGASDKRFQTIRANNLVMWKAIEHYGSLDCREFSFGRTEPDNKGLLQFKAGWGTKESTIHYLKYDLNNSVFVKAQSKTKGVHNAIFSRMPIPALDLFGKLFYRHMG